MTADDFPPLPFAPRHEAPAIVVTIRYEFDVEHVEIVQYLATPDGGPDPHLARGNALWRVSVFDDGVPRGRAIGVEAGSELGVWAALRAVASIHAREPGGVEGMSRLAAGRWVTRG